MSGTVTRIHKLGDQERRVVLGHVEPHAIVTVAPLPEPRNAIYARLKVTLQRMTPGSNESFLVNRSTLVYQVAKANSMKITTRREGDKLRVWRLS